MAVERLEITQRLVWLARTPGCGSLCGDRFGHHAETHERHGAEQERIRASERRSIVTGILSVDLAEATVRVAGQQIAMSGRVWHLLAALARRVGECVPRDDLIRDVFGTEWLETPEAVRHNLSITLSRLRSVLGPAAALVVTRLNIGVQLFAVPPGEASTAELDEALRLLVNAPRRGVVRRLRTDGYWSQDYDQCQRCGRNDRPYEGRGFCSGCYSHWRRERDRARRRGEA